MFQRHSGRLGYWYRKHFEALASRLGPFDPLSRDYAAAAAAWWCEHRSDRLALEEAEYTREQGRGRRPSAASIARLKKRAGLSWSSYDAAVRRLEELAGSRNGHRDPLGAVEEAVRRANEVPPSGNLPRVRGEGLR